MISRSLLSSLLSLLLITSAASGCSNQASVDNKQPVRQKAATVAAQPAAPPGNALAKNIYQARCMACHGAAGKGDGAGAVALEPRPRDLTDQEWQMSVTDEHIKKVILEGGAAVGKSPQMPPHTDLASKSDVVDGLVALVRSYKHTP